MKGRGGRLRLAIESLSDHRHPLFARALALYARVFPEKERIDRRYFVRILEEKRLGLLRPFNLHFLVARRGSEGTAVGKIAGIERNAW